MNIENSSIKRDAVRENILKIAQEIFSKFGYKKTTLDDIANAVRKGKSSLYYYFNSKEELFQEVIQKEADTLREELSKVLQKNIDPAEKLRDYVMTKITTYRQLANFYNAIENDAEYCSGGAKPGVSAWAPMVVACPLWITLARPKSTR